MYVAERRSKKDLGGDVIKADLQEIKVPEAQWHKLAGTFREGWRVTYVHVSLEERRTRREGEQLLTSSRVVCHECDRSFYRQEEDKRRHKCTSERLKPVSEQLGAVQCQTCHYWF